MDMMRSRKVLLVDEHDELGGDIVMDLFELTPANIKKDLNCNTFALMNRVAHKRPSAIQQRYVVTFWHRYRQQYKRTEELERTRGIWSSLCTNYMSHIQLPGNNVHNTSEIVTLRH